MNRFRLARRLPIGSGRRTLAAGLAAACLLAACGDDDDTSATDPAGEQPTATDSASSEAPAPTDAPTTDGGGDDDPYGPGPTDTAVADTASEPTTGDSGAAAGGAIVGTAETDLGEVLVDAEGYTLYGFLNDGEGESTCFDGCAETWPPVLVEGGGEPDVGTLDASVFSVVDHPEGPMLKAGDYPLYRYAADQAPGEVNGQGVGDVWYAMAPDGTMITD